MVSISNALAEGAIVLKKDEKAPFSGVLLPEDIANQLKNDSIDKYRYKLINESLEKSLTLTKDNLEITEKQNTVLFERNINMTKALNSSREMTNWERIAWFGAGILTSILVTYGTIQLVK